MNQPQSQSPLRIHTPCPKKWEELTGKGSKRFCSECSLHVHDAGQLKQAEAHALVSNATSRVCMRIEYDASGAPLYRDTRPASPGWSKRVARWTLSAAAGLLAACHGSVSTSPTTDPANGTNPAPQPGKLGQITTTELGDVAVPQPPQALMGKVAAPQPPQVMGEASVAPAPVGPEKPAVPPDHDQR